MKLKNEDSDGSGQESRYPRLVVLPWRIALEYEGYTYGLGWWPGSNLLWSWSEVYYDGYWFGARLGPFFYSRGPY